MNTLPLRTWTVVALLAACARGEPQSSGGDAARADQTDPTGSDPCTLVSQAEMERFMGPLGEPPYRVDNNRRADPKGDDCLYRDRTGRYVVLGVDWDGGPLLMKIAGATAMAAEDLLGTRDMSADTLEAAWDEAGITFGRLIALKDSTAVTVDPMGSQLDRGAQARIAALALSRVNSPLPYNGASAARSRPPDPAPRNPCTLVRRAEAEALMGPLRGDPTPSDDGTECTFTLREEAFGSPIVNSLTVAWRDGYYMLGEERLATGMAETVMTQDMGEIPELARNSSGEGEPWDDSQVLLGGRVIVVAHDMMFQAIGTGFNGFDEAKATELLRIAVQRALAN
jgi:hypothetical protein